MLSPSEIIVDLNELSGDHAQIIEVSDRESCGAVVA